VVWDQSYSGVGEVPESIGATAVTEVLEGIGSSFNAVTGTLRRTMEKPMTLSRPTSVTGKSSLVAVQPLMSCVDGDGGGGHRQIVR